MLGANNASPQKQIQFANRKESIGMGYFNNSHTIIKITSAATFNSPNLCIFFDRYPNFTFSASKVCRVSLGQGYCSSHPSLCFTYILSGCGDIAAERDLAGINAETTHFRWIFPCRGQHFFYESYFHSRLC